MPYPSATASSRWASSCRTTPRHSLASSSVADAEDGQVGVPELVTRGRGVAQQDVDDVPGAVALPALGQPAHRGQQLLRGHGPVPGLRRAGARVAVAAGLGLLPEVGEQLDAAALDGLAEGEHRVEVRGEPAAVGGVAVGVVDHPALLARRRRARRPATRSPAGRRARRDRSPGSSPRRTWAGRGGRRSGRRACRCPCRTRWSRPSPAPSSRRNRAWLRARTPRVEARVVGQGR